MLDPDNEPGGRCGKLADNHSPSTREGRAGSLLGVVALAIVVYLGFVAVRSSAKPAISVTILGYTRQGKLLCARVSLANKGRESICYNNGGGLLGPDGWLLAESSSGWTHREIGGVILSPSLLCPGSNTVFTVVLPLDTLRWQGGVPRAGHKLKRMGYVETTQQMVRSPLSAVPVAVASEQGAKTRNYDWPS